MKHYTTFEQSKKLLSLGLKAESADMAYIESPIGEFIPVAYTPKETIVARDSMGSDAIIYPCWSIGALLEVMPHNIFGEEDSTAKPSLCFDGFHCICGYQDSDNFWRIVKGSDKTIITAVYKMVVWLLENNYII